MFFIEKPQSNWGKDGTLLLMKRFSQDRGRFFAFELAELGERFFTGSFSTVPSAGWLVEGQLTIEYVLLDTFSELLFHAVVANCEELDDGFTALAAVDDWLAGIGPVLELRPGRFIFFFLLAENYDLLAHALEPLPVFGVPHVQLFHCSESPYEGFTEEGSIFLLPQLIL
jgi:hypothetical protein